jgi:hypothetical protein
MNEKGQFFQKDQTGKVVLLNEDEINGIKTETVTRKVE